MMTKKDQTIATLRSELEVKYISIILTLFFILHFKNNRLSKMKNKRKKEDYSHVSVPNRKKTNTNKINFILFFIFLKKEKKN